MALCPEDVIGLAQDLPEGFAQDDEAIIAPTIGRLFSHHLKATLQVFASFC